MSDRADITLLANRLDAVEAKADKDAPIGERRTKVLGEYSDATKNVSLLVKSIGFGLIALFYTLRTEVAGSVPSTFLLYCIGVCGALTILADYLHYIFKARAALDAYENEGRHRRSSRNYVLGCLFYKSKQTFTFIGCVAVVPLIVLS